MLNILLIGAFERDNFGDYLFYLLYRKLLGNARVVPAGILFSDQRETIGSLVYPYSHLLQSEKWDAVILAGGELGAVSQEMAIRMCLNAEDEKKFRALPEQDDMIRFLTGLDAFEPAYLPDLGRYPLNAETPLLVNSVGIARLALLDQGWGFVHESLRRLAQARYLSVRDEASLAYLEKNGVQAVLMPDIAHGVRTCWPDAGDVAGEPGDYALVQISAELVMASGVEMIAGSLCKALHDTAMNVLFFAAGTASYHDDFSLYEAIAQAMREAGFAGGVDVLYERDPLQLAGYIARARLWVGTSLHGRILASEYSIPRISLSNAKVAEYISQWDSAYPGNVGFVELADQVAVVLAGKPDLQGQGHAHQVVNALRDALHACLPSYQQGGLQEAGGGTGNGAVDELVHYLRKQQAVFLQMEQDRQCRFMGHAENPEDRQAVSRQQQKSRVQEFLKKFGIFQRAGVD